MYNTNHLVYCQINPEAIEELASGNWSNLEEIVIGKNIFMKWMTNNLETMDADD